jgi:SRSO17 transposase
LELPRKSIEPLVLALDGATPKAGGAMQQCLSAGAWDDDVLLNRHWEDVDRELGEADGVLTVDGSDFRNQGQEAVGVKRQYCGDVGQRANGHAGGYWGYAGRQGSTLLDRRLYVPQAWVADAADAQRRRRGQVPTALTFKTKPLLGWEMREAVPQAGSLRGRGVTCDAAVGRDTSGLDHLDGRGLGYLAEVPHDTQGWRPRPATGGPAWSGPGRQPTRTRVLAGEAAPEAVARLAAARPADAWTRHPSKAGSQGPLVARVAALRVIAGRDGVPGPEVWLVLRRHGLTGAWQT